MKRMIGIAALTLSSIIIWTGLIFVIGSEGWFKRPIAADASAQSFIAAAADIVEQEHRGNLSMLVIEGGEVAASYHTSTGKPVDENSVFQVASLSKWLAAWGVMALVEDGVIDLDEPVSRYITGWQLPSGPFDNDGVTTRRLLSHTAGLDDGLGYAGFDSESAVQSLESSLSRAMDASPGKSGVVKVGSEPGTSWNYSGGGYTLLQLLIEEVSGQPFTDYMAERIFEPLNMSQSSFDHKKAAGLGLAEIFDLKGNVEPLQYYSSLASTSLFTSSRDMALFLAVQGPGSGHSVLSEASMRLMRQPHASKMGANIWGLGTMLYTPNNAGDFIFGHDGNNEPAINTAVRLDPDTGNGIVVFETGSELLATRLASEWVFWKTGRVDNLAFAMGIPTWLLWAGAGSFSILLMGIALGWRRRKR
ncbi:serine hydrolase domain-containing protein [Parasphingorhabdus sp. JC815]|uniref:serine hydrolase domain-containing protein n=1 Tax=Parasphingorhabdus sp. JC815 TaxID=3232140 RepID=UPI00345B038E